MDTLYEPGTAQLHVARNAGLSNENSNTTERIPELDGLRGIAILLVIAFHYINNQLTSTESSLGRLFWKATSYGWVGVDLFFVLSGFLIGSILLKHRSSKNFFTTFYIRRFVRIIPNYYLAVTLFLIICAIPFFNDSIFLTGDNVLPWWSYYAMVHNIFMGRHNTMGNQAMSVTWSIGIEEQFYIVFPFIVYYIKEKWLPALLFTVIVAACFIRMQYHTWYPTYVLLPSRMDSIAFGILVAYYNRHINLTAFVRKYFIYFNLVLALDVAVCAFLYLRYDDLFAIKHSLFALVFSVCLVFALTLNDSLYAKILRNKLLVWIGTLSYSLYLFHYFILGILHYLVGNNKLIIIANGRDIMITIAALIISVLFAWGVFKVFETPMVKLGKRYRY